MIHQTCSLPYEYSLLGAMGSYATFYLAGLYPLPATSQYLLSSPFFPQISFFNPLFNTTTTITSKGFTGNPPNGTGGNVFVQVRLSNVNYSFMTLTLTFSLECCCERKAVQVKLLPWLGCFRERFVSWTFPDGRHHARLWQRWKCTSAFLVNGRLWLVWKWKIPVTFIGRRTAGMTPLIDPLSQVSTLIQHTLSFDTLFLQ